jgi:purine catabolism regulator
MEARKAIEIGSYIYPDKDVISFYDLGPFGVLRFEDVERKNFGSGFNSLEPLMKEEDGKELIETLKVYFESGSNCNKAASKLFIHSNTVRYRINKIQELCKIDLEDYIERLKLEISLRFLG